MIILDIEASGLHEDSYPIQLAWLNTVTGEEDSFYITPEEDWTYWDEFAEEIHNIPRRLLHDVGIPADLAVKRFLKGVGNDATIYTDAPDYDGFWLTRLFNAVVLEPNVNIKIDSVYNLCTYMEEVDQLRDVMSNQNRPHDALEDCRMIRDALKEVIG